MKKTYTCEGCGLEQPRVKERYSDRTLQKMPSEWCGYGSGLARPSTLALWCPQCQADGTMDRENSFARRATRPRRRRDYQFVGHGAVAATFANGAEVQVEFTAVTTTALSGHLRRSARLIEGMSRRAREWLRLAHAER